MKKLLSSFVIGIIAGGAILFFVNQKWPLNDLFNKKTGSDTNIELIGNSKFSSVTSKLEKGGDLYFYLNTSKILKSIGNSLKTLKETINSSENIPELKKKDSDKWFSFFSGILNESGLMEISAIGVSSKEYEEGITRSKFIVQHDKGKGNGMIWNSVSQSPGDLRMIDILPKNTVLSSFSDFQYFKVWSWIKSIAERSGDDKIRFSFASMEKELNNIGVDLSELLRSINGNSGIILTFDENSKKKFKVAGKEIEFPDPALALVIETENDSIFKLLASKIPGVKIEEKEKKKIIKIKAPVMPFSFSPQIIQTGKMLIIASNSTIGDQILKSNKKKGLRNREEFIKLSKEMPLSGNGFTFISSSLFKEITKIRNKVDPTVNGSQNKGAELLKKLGLTFDNLSMFRVTSQTAEGYAITTNTTIRTELLMMIPVAAVGGIIAAVIIPQIIKKKPQRAIPKERSSNQPSQGLWP